MFLNMMKIMEESENDLVRFLAMRPHYYNNTISNNRDSLQCKDLNTKYIIQNDYELTDISVIKELMFDTNQILSIIPH